MVVKAGLILPGVGSGVTVPLVEPMRVGIRAVDGNLNQLGATLTAERFHRAQERRAESSPARLRYHIKLVDEDDRAVVPHVGAQRQQRNRTGGISCKKSDYIATGQQAAQSGGQYLGPW